MEVNEWDEYVNCGKAEQRNQWKFVKHKTAERLKKGEVGIP